ncbi:MAG: hypothetical protein R3Y63_10245 [Eubacteriales bacterium]
MKKANYVFLVGEREAHLKNFPFLEGVEPEVKKMPLAGVKEKIVEEKTLLVDQNRTGVYGSVYQIQDQPEWRKLMQEFYEVGTVCREQIGRFQVEGLFRELLIFIVKSSE